MKRVFCMCIMSTAIFVVKADNSNHTVGNTTADESETPREIFEQIMTEQCTRRYSLMCLKLDAIKLVDRLGHSPGYQLLPGVSLVHVNDDADQRLPQQVIASLVEGNVTSLDTFLVRRIQNFVDSLTLSVKVLDSGTVVRAKTLGENILYGSSTAVAEGRKKKGGHGHGGGGGGGHGGHAAMWMCGTIAAIGMAGLAAVSGKALMASLLALVLAAAGAMKGGGGGGHKCGGHYDSTGRDLPLDTITSSANTLVQLPELKSAFEPVSNGY